MSILDRLINAPDFSDEERTARAQTFHRTAWAIVIAHTTVLLLILAFQPGIALRTVVAMTTIATLGAVTLWLNRRGHTRPASIILVVGMVTLATSLALAAGGIRSPGVTMYFIFVMMTGMLLGQRAAIGAAAACLTLGFVLVQLELRGMLPVSQVRYSPVTFWLLNAYYIAVVLALLRIATGALAKALSRANSELRERRAVEAEREAVVVQLKERVKELKLLHGAARLLRDRQFDLAVLRDFVNLIPEGWQHPDVCEARITFQGIEVSTPGWRDSPWEQSMDFMTSGGGGTIAVRYTEQRPVADEGPFLAEERSVLESLSEMLVAWLEWEQVELRRKGTENQLRQSQKMEALGTLAGGIAHDFNNILSAILGNAYFGMRDAEKGLPVKQSFESIKEASERAADIVKRILLFSRRQEPERKVIPLQPVVEEAVKLVTVSLPKGVKVETHFAPDLPHISGDASQLYQVFMNLGTNSAYAMATTGGVLSVSMDEVDVTEAVASQSADLQPGRYLRVTVTDTGSGMTKETLDRVFEPFFTTKGQAGTGLGLSVVHGIVMDHGGAILMESEPGKGTTSRVFLPAVATVVAGESAEANRDWSGNGETLMYVDDEEALISVMERSLRQLNYQCVAFNDPAAALREFAANPDRFDAVLTDLAMPGMTGLELTRRMREIRPQLRVALVSGHHDAGPRATQVGIGMRVHKPFTVDVLGFALHQLFKRKGGAS